MLATKRMSQLKLTEITNKGDYVSVWLCDAVFRVHMVGELFLDVFCAEFVSDK